MNIYNESNYIRSQLFLEQDLIYGRSVEFNQGLELICVQDKVKVEIRGYDTQYSPVDMNNISPGEYSIKLIKTGYYTAEFRVTITSDQRTSIFVNLKKYTSLLKIKNIPDEAEIYINSHKITKKPILIPFGENKINISLFGYEDYFMVINVINAEEYILTPELIKRKFAFNSLDINKEDIWLNDSKSQKKTKIIILADSPGTGTIEIKRESDNHIVASSFLSFDTFKTQYIFDINNKNIKPGNYRISVQGSDASDSDFVESQITIHKGMKSYWRNNVSGFSGSIFCPSAETLPAGGAQLQTIVSSIFNTESISDIYVPAQLTLRIGITNSLEISLGTGLYISTETDKTAFNLFLSGKYSFITTDGSDGFTISTALSLNYNGKLSSFDKVPDYDPFANFTGLSIIIPLQYRIGILLFSIAPEFKFSPAYPGIDDGGFASGSFYLWNYFRGAVSLDLGEFSTGLSAALQSPSYINSNNQWPLFLGLDMNITPGETGFTGSIFIGFKYISTEPVKITSGISAGFIF